MDDINVSIVVHGKNREFHSPQFLIEDDPTRIYLELRPSTKASLCVGNRSISEKILDIKTDNLEVDGIEVISVPSFSKISIPLQRTNKKRASLNISSSGECKKIILANRNDLRDRFGIDVTKINFPKAFANIPSVIKLYGDNIAREFADLSTSFRFDVKASPTFSDGRVVVQSVGGGDGYVYLMIHPKHIGWTKIGSTVDLMQRLSTYQTSDPLRQYKFICFKQVDDRLAIEKWLFYYFKSKGFDLTNEWVKLPASKAMDVFNQALNILEIK